MVPTAPAPSDNRGLITHCFYTDIRCLELLQPLTCKHGGAEGARAGDGRQLRAPERQGELPSPRFLARSSQSRLTWPMQWPMALETSPFAVRSLRRPGEPPLRRGAQTFLGQLYSQKFLSPFQAECGPLATPRTTRYSGCLLLSHASLLPVRYGWAPEKQASPEGDLPFSSLAWPSPKNPGETTLPKWVRETKVLTSPWKVGCQDPGADTANSPTRGPQHTSMYALPVLGA